MKRAFITRHSPRQSWLMAALLGIFLLFLFILPVGTLLLNGLGFKAAPLLLEHPLYVESLVNSITTALGAALLAAGFALPVALTLWRFGFYPPLGIELCGFLPLFVPPFMLSLSLQSLLGRGGALGFLLAPLDLDPALWGLSGVALIEAIHYFPLVLVTLILSTSTFSRQANEAARLGNSWTHLATRVFLPLGWPGLAFGMAITFLKTLDDLATPLSLGITNLLAPQAYFRVFSYGSQDPLSSLMAISMILTSVLVWAVCVSFVRQGASWVSTTTEKREKIKPRHRRISLALLWSIAGFYLFCYAGMFLTSIAGIWSHSPLPESLSAAHYLSALETESGSFINTLTYCGLAAFIDIAVGMAMAYAIRLSQSRWVKHLSWAVTGLLSVPGVALAIAYLQFFHGMQLPLLDEPLDSPWFLLPMAFSVRGLPFAIRACAFAWQGLPDSHVEAANLSGASRLSIALRIILPTMAFGLLMAFLISFGIAAVDLSSAMLLVPSETDAPISYTIYLNMQTSTGRGTGSALAVLTIAAIGLTIIASVALIRRRGSLASNLRRTLFLGNPTTK